MRKVFIICAMVCVIGMMTSCDEKEQDLTPKEQDLTPAHNPLFQTSWEGRYNVDWKGEGYELHDHYILLFNFLTDDSVRVYGEKWETNPEYNTLPYKVAQWNDTMKYSFSKRNGVIYGVNGSIWSGNETPIRYGINHSLQIKTRQIGFVSLTKK